MRLPPTNNFRRALPIENCEKIRHLWDIFLKDGDFTLGSLANLEAGLNTKPIVRVFVLMSTLWH